MSWFDTILSPIMWVVAWIMVLAHRAFVAIGLPASGWSWILSIVVLVIVIRIILIPLFVRQIKAQRGMQMVQPEIQKLQKKYKGKTDPASRQAMQQEMMAIYREAGTSPFASCLPLLAQSPIFFALFRVLYLLPDVASGARGSIGPLDATLAAEAENSTLFGAPLSATFMSADATAQVRIVTVLLILAMSATMFFTQRQLTMKNMPASALDNPMARQQKMLMYIFPIIFAVTGVNFPIGVLIYWTTTNLWTMGQQFYVIRRNPAPGSEAEKAMLERRARRAEKRGETLEDSGDVAVITDAKPAGGQRQQPVSAKRAKRQGLPKQQGQAGAAEDSQDGAADGGTPEVASEQATDSVLEDPPAPGKKKRQK
ncbi:membrane protein insertase YidC [Serinibacter salmoneus]|uniref:Membrane protein insertase YidC n=1 Tax=Serinibacter salmoneus TaxID=556530 RepID=A0A2A9D3B8_9MICO|nr:membrane protein insertase YidC [Serinibacter salmoneus]PFG21153.1 YidC/Oxa1 family membrane protein insertase [Serinibacter salmoneus]